MIRLLLFIVAIVVALGWIEESPQNIERRRRQKPPF